MSSEFSNVKKKKRHQNPTFPQEIPEQFAWGGGGGGAGDGSDGDGGSPIAVRDAQAAPRPRADHTGLVLLKDAQPLRQPTTHLKTLPALRLPAPHPRGRTSPGRGWHAALCAVPCRNPAASRGCTTLPCSPKSQSWLPADPRCRWGDAPCARPAVGFPTNARRGLR